MLVEEESNDLEVLELLECFILSSSLKPAGGMSDFVSVELDTMAAFEVCKKYNFDKVEVLRVLKNAVALFSNIINGE
ncbi:hypothetical protein [Helicobacter suis]|uniref:hypothetical protein n=1 Tax=Helicobacter suis TaxID=104628 RepID=UPI0013D6DCF1|nr:hypothetical protein [Helicobacter suis]